jgi:predicted dehydrogenase
MQPIRVGLVGAGGIAARHAIAYRKLQRHIRLTAVTDIDADRAASLAGNFAAATYDDFSRMLADADIEAVDICLPHHAHARAVLAAIAAGKHVLCEKPLCTTMADAALIDAAATAARVTVMCMHNRLFSPVVTQARDLLAGGLLGRVYQVRATDCFRNELDGAALGWRASVAATGGGELIDTGYHPTYLVLTLAGDRPAEVVALTSRHRLSFLEGEDSAQVLVRFEGGAVGQIATSWAYQAPDSYEHFSVAGELGSMSATRTRLTYRRDGEPPVTLHYAKGDDITAAIEHFAACLAEGTRPRCTHEDGATTLAVLRAAYDSVVTGAVTPVDVVDRRAAVR